MERNAKSATATPTPTPTTDWTEDIANDFLLFANAKSQTTPRYTPFFKAFMIVALFCLAEFPVQGAAR